MKSVLISIQPKWCAKIANGEKTIEVRKKRPKLETPFKCYIYCTKSKKHFLQSKDNMFFYCEESDFIGKHGAGLYQRLNGKVIGEFVCDRIYEWNYKSLQCIKGVINTYFPIFADDLPKTCLSHKDLEGYGKGKTLYGWRIADLKIYDKPKELGDFRKYYECGNNSCGSCDKCDKDYHLKRPPQSWCYVDGLQNG